MPQKDNDKQATGKTSGLYTEYPFADFESNFTKVRNSIFDYLMKYCTPPAFMVLMVVYRKTLGWNKEWDQISYSQFEELTGLSHGAVYHALRFLRGLPDKRTGKKPEYTLIKERRDGQIVEYSLNKRLPIRFVYSENDNQYFKNTGTSTPNELEPVHEMNTQKTIQKKIKTQGEVDFDTYFSEILEIYNQVFGKQATGSQKFREAAATAYEKGITIRDYAEGCNRYKANGTMNIRGPESIFGWAENVKHDRENSVEANNNQGTFWGRD